MRLALMAELQREAITARIKQARTEAGLTQAEMAEVLDVVLRTYWNYEDSREGEGRVPWSLLDRIGEVTGKSTAWLIHGDEAAEPGGEREQLDRIEDKLDWLCDEWMRVVTAQAVAEAFEAPDPERRPTVRSGDANGTKRAA